MASYGPPQALYYVAQALSCIIFLAGFVAGIIAITRKKTLPGILAAAAFFLLGLDVLVRIILQAAVFPVMGSSGAYATYNWLYFCLTTPLFLLGVIALVVLAFTNISAKVEKTASEIEEPPPIE